MSDLWLAALEDKHGMWSDDPITFHMKLPTKRRNTYSKTDNIVTPEEMGQRFIKAWHDAEVGKGTAEQRIAQDIMDEACLPQHLYDQGDIAAIQSTIVSALRQTREIERDAIAEKYRLRTGDDLWSIISREERP